jgi:hypothetical protein
VTVKRDNGYGLRDEVWLPEALRLRYGVEQARAMMLIRCGLVKIGEQRLGYWVNRRVWQRDEPLVFCENVDQEVRL